MQLLPKAQRSGRRVVSSVGGFRPRAAAAAAAGGSIVQRDNMYTVLRSDTVIAGRKYPPLTNTMYI